MINSFMRWLGRKFIPWDPWEFRAANERAFDRGRENGRRIERQRLIRLVESQTWVGDTVNDDTANLIRLIKGNK